MSSLVVLALVVTSLAVCCGRPQYRSRIPNAGTSGGAASLVPAPFGTANVFCISVGHNGRCDGAPYDGGNPFGKAFLNAGLTWTRALCMADSDNDGDSNGVELGDPMCTWTAGTTPPVTTGLSHPGYSCSTSSNPFCVPTGTATAPPRSTGDDDDDDDDDNEEEHAPSWESAIGCACVIFAVKYILILFSGIKAECETTSTKSSTYAVHKASKTTEEDDTIKEHPLEVCAYESINEVPRVREQNTPEKTVYHV